MSKLAQGSPHFLGATFDGTGVNFALFSANAEKVELCLFDGDRETERIALPERTDDVWHGYLPQARTGLLYGYRVHGPYDPFNGHRFNPNKLLIDPYARALDRPFEWNDIHCGYIVGDPREDLSFDTRDNAALIPKSRVADRAFDWQGDAHPQTPMARSVIYELHVRGYTKRHPAIAANLRGSFAALGRPEIIRHLRELGITAVELLPVHACATTRALADKGLRDYWGYNSINFFALEPRYLSTGGVGEFRQMVRAFHDAGIEVILDVVFNHSGEDGEFGPTLSFRGIDNASYYCLGEDKRRYLDFTGCRNTLNFAHPRVLQMVMDSLRYWVQEMHVDGFRFDLAVALARERHHFSPNATLFTLIAQDPVLAKAKLIAEPWDLGVDGYQLGAFPPRWSEWNDKYRDGLRHFWRGDGGLLGDLAYRLTGSSDVFAARKPAASLNYITAHDGFTLEDLVSYDEKHNIANGESNADGTNENFSWNCGSEGKTSSPAIAALRKRQKRNLMASLLLSQGVPMVLGGDEFGRTQNGNNNAYCQDSETSWLNWHEPDAALLKFVQRLVQIRAQHPVFRRARFFHGDYIDGNELKDIVWLSPDGHEMAESDWNDAEHRFLGVRYARDVQEQDVAAFLLLMNAGDDAVQFPLPSAAPGSAWKCILDTHLDEAPSEKMFAENSSFPLAGHCLALFVSVD
jgi:isoamylase